MPKGAMNGDAITTNHSRPWHCWSGIPRLKTASRHILGDDLPMGKQVAYRRGELIADLSGCRIVLKPAGDAAKVDFGIPFITGQCLIIQIGFDAFVVRVHIRVDRSYISFGEYFEGCAICPEELAIRAIPIS